MREAKSKGDKINFKDLLRLIKLHGGMSPLTYKRYFKDLEDFGFIKRADNDKFQILKTER